MTDKKIELRKQAEEEASHLPEEMDAMSPEEIRQTLHELRVHKIELTMQNDELRRSQAELDAEGARYFDFYDLAPVGYFTLNEEGLILEANLTAATLLGVARSDLIKQPFSRYILKEDADSYYLHRKQLFEKAAPQTWEMRMLQKEVTTFWALIEAIVAKDADGDHVCRIVMINSTLRKRMEEELLRAQKLESLGVLAGGIAHDFNNLLGVVQGYMDLVINDLPPCHVSRQLLLTAMRSVSQTKDLTSRLITFSRGGGLIKEIFDVTEIIREAVQRTVKGTKVRVIFDFREELWPAEIDDLQMKQVFNHLTKNAVEATPEGGILTIQAENSLLPAGGVLDLKAGAYLKITFTDEGTGIPEDHLAKVFDPYFSTKRLADQNGMGLGLAVCYSVLKSHDGHITVQSLPGQGASFVLYIPARPELAKGKEVKKTTSTAPRIGPVRVLIMDDESQVRDIMRAYLERMDCEVTDVQDAQEAIDAFRMALESETPFDLALLALKVRQGMGGEMTMKRLLKIAPAIKAIIVSEYVDDPVMLNYADYGFQGALRKPVEREEMKHLVEKVLRDNCQAPNSVIPAELPR